MKKHLIFAFLFITVQSVAQHALKPYLIDLNNPSSELFADGFRTYANGDYKKALQLLLKENSDAIPYFENFYANAVIYQRNSDLINEEITGYFPFYQFYKKQAPMRVQLQGQTTVALSKNLFKAILNKRDT